MKTILFLHGFFSSGQCPAAASLRESFRGEAQVLTPDLPPHPGEALGLIRGLCDIHQPDLLVGNSCGSFYAQMTAPLLGVPALLGNPHLAMSEFLRARVGEHRYKSPRADGRDTFTIDGDLIAEFESLQGRQFAGFSPYYSDKVWGMFGEKDGVAHFEEEFRTRYSVALHFPGAHTPTPQEVRDYYVPACRQLLERFPRRKERYFRHFKGGTYRMVGSGLDSETLGRVVVYRAMYGSGPLWVRPEDMFFGTVTRDGRTFPRFEEFDPDLTATP